MRWVWAMLAWCVGCGSTTTAPAIAPTAPVEESAATARAVPDLDVSRYPYTFRLIGEQERERVEHEIEAGSPGWDVEIGELGYVTGGYARLDALGEDRDAAIATFVDRWRTPLGLAPDAVSGWSDYYRAWGVSTHPPWPYVRTTFGIEGELVVLRGHGFHGLPYPSRGSDAEPPSVLERYVGRPITITHSVHSRPCDPARQCRTVEECCGRPPEAPPPRDELLTADRLRPIAGLVISFDRARGGASRSSRATTATSKSTSARTSRSRASSTRAPASRSRSRTSSVRPRRSSRSTEIASCTRRRTDRDVAW
jgi:hypothetical protein